MRWRRMIGQDPTPCSPMVRRPRDRDRVHKIMRRIMAAEDELIDNLHSVNAGLARRVLRQMPRAKADPLNSVRDKRA
jgi:hypothetical protein